MAACYRQSWAQRRYKRRYFFGCGSAADFFVTSEKRQRRCFLAKKAAVLQRPILRKYSAVTANKLLS